MSDQEEDIKRKEDNLEAENSSSITSNEPEVENKSNSTDAEASVHKELNVNNPSKTVSIPPFQITKPKASWKGKPKTTPKRSDNDIEEFDTDEEEEEDVTKKKSIPPFLITKPKAFWKEKPKTTPKRSDDDVEEFDTDEEEEGETKKSSEQTSTPQNYTEHLSYEGDKCIYTEPGTGRKMIWNGTENKWCPQEQSENKADTTDAMKNYEFDGKNYVYTNKESNVTYKFIQEKNEWIVKDEKEDESKADKDEKESIPTQPTAQGIYGFENDTHIYTDPADGTSYFWDREKNAWFPKVDDDFMARYQLSYGFTDTSNATSSKTESEPADTAPEPQTKPAETKKMTKQEKKEELKRKAKEPPSWFDIDEAHNTTVYISNLPLDVTLDEVIELVTKCGLLARDEKGKDKIKLYTDEDGELKGDARCTYIKIESVNLALEILDGWQLRDKTLSVQRAKFQLKGDYDPTKKPKRKKNYKEKQKKIHQKLLDWRPDRMLGEPLKCERVVIIKNLFAPEDFDKDVTLLLEYQQDVRSECVKCGEVKKVTIYDRHPEGVAQVTFKEPEEAEACIQLLNGRWFGQRRITAEIWDGKTKYKIKETEDQIEARINKWDKFLEDQEEAEEKAKKEGEVKKNTEGEASTAET